MDQQELPGVVWAPGALEPLQASNATLTFLCLLCLLGACGVLFHTGDTCAPMSQHSLRDSCSRVQVPPGDTGTQGGDGACAVRGHSLSPHHH